MVTEKERRRRLWGSPFGRRREGGRVLISRFLKTENSGEVPVLRNIPGIEVMPCQKTFGFTFQMNREEKEEAGLYYTEQFQRLGSLPKTQTF